MESHVTLLVVENRDMILLEYCKFILQQMLEGRIDDLMFWHEGTRRQVWYMRREMIEQALKTDCTHVLFVDTDVIPPVNTVERLLQHDLPLVSGYYCDTSGAPVNRLEGKAYLGKGVEAVDVFSMGLSLIRRDVLEKIEYPEPDQKYKFDADVEFCRLAKAAGFQPMCDFNLRGFQLLLGNF